MIWFGRVLWHINPRRLFNTKSSSYISIKYIWFGFVWFYGISTLVGYLIPNPLYRYLLKTWFGLVQFQWESNSLVMVCSSSLITIRLHQLSLSLRISLFIPPHAFLLLFLRPLSSHSTLSLTILSLTPFSLSFFVSLTSFSSFFNGFYPGFFFLFGLCFLSVFLFFPPPFLCIISYSSLSISSFFPFSMLWFFLSLPFSIFFFSF